MEEQKRNMRRHKTWTWAVLSVSWKCNPKPDEAASLLLSFLTRVWETTTCAWKRHGREEGSDASDGSFSASAVKQIFSIQYSLMSFSDWNWRTESWLLVKRKERETRGTFSSLSSLSEKERHCSLIIVFPPLFRVLRGDRVHFYVEQSSIHWLTRIDSFTRHFRCPFYSLVFHCQIQLLRHLNCKTWIRSEWWQNRRQRELQVSWTLFYCSS